MLLKQTQCMTSTIKNGETKKLQGFIPTQHPPESRRHKAKPYVFIISQSYMEKVHRKQLPMQEGSPAFNRISWNSCCFVQLKAKWRNMLLLILILIKSELEGSFPTTWASTLMLQRKPSCTNCGSHLVGPRGAIFVSP